MQTETAQDPSQFATEARDTALICLVAVAAHHGVASSEERLIHDHALGDTPLSDDQVVSIARSMGLKAGVKRPGGKGLEGVSSVFPAMARLDNGNYVILVGLDENEEGRFVVLMDPTSGSSDLIAVPRDAFEAQWPGQVVLLKRVYSLSDENQPFSLRWFVPEILKQKREFRDVTVAVLLLHLIGLLTPIFFQLVIDKVLVHQSFSTLYVLTGGIIVALLFEAAFGYLRQYLLLFATNKIDIRLVTRTFSHLLALPVSFFERTAAGVTTRHMQQVEKIREFLTGQLFLTGLDATVLIVYLPVLFFYSPFLTWVVLGFTAAITLVMVLLIGPFKRRLQALYDAEAERQAMLVETISGMRTVKSLAIEPAQRRAWDQRAANAVNTHFAVGKIGLTANTISSLFEKLMVVSIIALGAMQVFDGVITVGALIAFNMLSGRVVSPLVQLVSLIHEYQETALSVRMLGSVMNHPPERQSGQSGIRPQFEGAIAFDGVSFAYSPVSGKVLDNINLQIEPGSVIGVVGRSGSGKSTLTKLIQGLYNPQDGVIRLDGYDLREIDLDHLRRNIGVVLQDSFLFRGTVRENIAMSRPDASMEEVVQMARLAGADEFVERLPQGFDTPLEENAVNLSGGQKQRLAIARALITYPRYLILDEATSALDPDSEAIFMDNLAGIAKGRTVVIVSHRLSTLASCDRILVMDDGQVVDSGTHAELLQSSEIYRHLWDQQNRNK